VTGSGSRARWTTFEQVLRIDLVGTYDVLRPAAARMSGIRDGLAASVPHPRRLGAPDVSAHTAVSLLGSGYLDGHTVRLEGASCMAPR